MTNEVILLTSDAIGRGDDALGRVLMANFLRFQLERPEPPATIICMNSAVKLACRGDVDFEAQEYLHRLATRGVRVLSCRTCLEHFGLLNDVVIGEVGGMGMFVTMMSQGRVLTL